MSRHSSRCSERDSKWPNPKYLIGLSLGEPYHSAWYEALEKIRSLGPVTASPVRFSEFSRTKNSAKTAALLTVLPLKRDNRPDRLAEGEELKTNVLRRTRSSSREGEARLHRRGRRSAPPELLSLDAPPR
jgi:hypothetical protein